MLPNFRKNPLTGHWIIVAEGREMRPNEFRSGEERSTTERCPFCAGHEDDTPGEVAAYDQYGNTDDLGPWNVRVVPNKYPALEIGEPFQRPDVSMMGGDFPPTSYGPYGAFQSGGCHELVVESNRHVVSFGDLTDTERRLSLRVYQERLLRIRDHRKLAYGMVFKNCRPGAGASIEHAHSQIIGTPVVPASVQQHVERTQAYRRQHQRSLCGDLVAFEVRERARVIAETADFVAFCPFASHMGYETWLFPKLPHRSFLELGPGMRDQLADLLFDCVRRLEAVLQSPPYNFTLHLAPFDSSADEDYQWHVELAPRLTKLAGFEWGTGCMILPMSPESAATRLREVPRS